MAAHIAHIFEIVEQFPTGETMNAVSCYTTSVVARALTEKERGNKNIAECCDAGEHCKRMLRDRETDSECVP